MHIKKIEIQNIISFKNAGFRFAGYNVIVGTNNSGKSNLIRILKMMSKSDNFDYFALDKQNKHSQTESSRITIDLEFTDDEIRLILQTLFNRQVKPMKFPESVRNISLTINWHDLINDQSHPSFLAYKFGSGLIILETDSKQMVFDTSFIENPTDFHTLLEEIKSYNMKQIIGYVTQRLKITNISEIGRAHV